MNSPRAVLRWPFPHRPFGLAAVLITAVFVVTPQVSDAQTTITLHYQQSFDSLGSGLPSGWDVWTDSTAISNGAAAAFSRTLSANNAAFSPDTAFRNVPGASQVWSAARSTGEDRALGWRAGSAVTRDGSITFTLSNSEGYMFSDLHFDIFTVNSSGTTAPLELFYRIGEDNPFTAFSPALTYTSNTAQNPLIVTTLSLSAEQLAPLNDRSERITFSFRNTYGSRPTAFNSIAIDNFSYTTSAIPEPSTYAIACGGLVLICAAVRRIRIRRH
mgnify:CR=1 FL=1